MVAAALAALALALPAASEQAFRFLGQAGAPADIFAKPSRPVASIISPIWHNETERDAANEASEVISALGVQPGMTVADIGAGSGYYTVKLAAAVGPSGKVYAQDVSLPYLKRLQARIAALKLVNVELGLGEPHDPRLPPSSVDAAFLIHMYHEIEQPFAFLHNLVPALKSGAKVGIVDVEGYTQYHGTPIALLRCELAAMGYRETSYTPLKDGATYLAVFEAPSAEARPAPTAVKACPQS
jgi:predicted methyltransferase